MEKFTTKPLVDTGIFRRIGNCPSPWPCFVIAVRNNFIESHNKELRIILNIINNTTQEFKNIPSIDKTIANRYKQELNDVQEWLHLTQWSQSLIDKKTIVKTQEKLVALNIIPKTVDYNSLIYKL